MMQTIVRRHPVAAGLAVSLTLLFAAGCSESAPESSADDAWVLGEDSGTSDTGGEDTSRPIDVGLPDASLDCRSIGDRNACTSQRGCEWWDDPCSSDPADGQCFDDDVNPTTPDCPPPAPCSELEDENRCEQRSECSWASKTCPDGTTVGACGGPADGKPLLECPGETSCAERAPDRCGDGNCRSYSPGCGDNPSAFDGPTCLSNDNCTDDTDCGQDLTCLDLAIQPDCDRCGACAVGRKKCVPKDWLGGGG